MEIIKLKDGSQRFKEKVYLPSGQSMTKTFRRKTEAVDWKRKTETEKTKNELLGFSPLKENVSFDYIFELWMSRRIRPARRSKTVADYQSIGNKHLLKFFGGIKIRSVERGHGDKLIKKLHGSGLSNKTINKILTVLKQILSFAEIERYVPQSPLRIFPMLKVTAGRCDYLTQQEIIQLLRANVSCSVYPLLVVALNTGMRIGELTGLCWDRLNFETNSIEVSRSLTRSGLIDSTKTNLVRHIPMNFEVKKVFLDLIRNQQSPKYVFVNEKGLPYNPDHYSFRHFQKAIERAGIRNVTFHILRHTYASQYVMNGGNIYDLQKILGHTKVEMTMVYAHLSNEHLVRAVDTVRFSAEGNKSVSPFIALRQNDSNLQIVK